MDNVTITGIEALRPGSYTDANGRAVVVTAAHVAEMAAVYDPDLQDAPAVVGHPKMDDPAYGWLRNPRVLDGVLLCDACDVDPEFAQALKDKRYKHKSLSFYLPGSPGNPKPGKHYIKHLGLLGARAPAVKGLKPIALAADDGAVTVELCEAAGPMSWALRSVAQAMGRFRDWIIQEQGIEAADGILPAYVADDLRSAADAVRDAAEDSTPAFSTPESPQSGDPMATPEDLAAREAAITQREADLAAREKSVETKEVALAAAEAETRKAADAAFVAGLIKDGRLAPGEKEAVLAELAAMDDGAAVISLAEGDGTAKLTARAAYRARLAKAPKLVALGEFDGGPAPVDLASADDIADRARAHMDAEAKAGRPISAAQAVTHVIRKEG